MRLPKPLMRQEGVVTHMSEDNINRISEADRKQLSAWFPQKNWEEYFWGFTCYSRQEYAGVVPLEGIDEILLGIQCAQGGCLSELALRWYSLDSNLTPRLEVFSGAWPLLQTPTLKAFMEQLTQMRMGINIVPTPDDVSRLLIAGGFKDQSDWPLAVACEELMK